MSNDVTARRFAFVTGGGTAGHTIPALAIARALLVGREPGSVELVGSRRGLDADLLSGVEFPVTLLGGRGIKRSRSVSATVSNLLALCGLTAAFASSLLLVARRRPSVVVAVGGYASVAPTVAAALLGVPVVVVNIDAVPGAANRLLAKLACAVAVAYPGTDLRRAVVTGAPLRSEVAAMAATAADVEEPGRSGANRCARRSLGLPDDALVVAAFGGSLGANRLNEAVLGLARQWAGRRDVAIYHVVGTRNAEWAATAAAELFGGLTARHGVAYVQVPYEDHMELVYAASDVAVCRAGANTVAELMARARRRFSSRFPVLPAIIRVRTPRLIERSGAGIVIQDGALDAETLAEELDRLLGDPGRLDADGRIRETPRGDPDAADEVAALAVRCATGPKEPKRPRRQWRSERRSAA